MCVCVYMYMYMYIYKPIDKLSLREQGSMSMKTELLYEAKKEWTVAFKCYSEFHGWRTNHETATSGFHFLQCISALLGLPRLSQRTSSTFRTFSTLYHFPFRSTFNTF